MARAKAAVSVLLLLAVSARALCHDGAEPTVVASPPSCGFFAEVSPGTCCDAAQLAERAAVVANVRVQLTATNQSCGTLSDSCEAYWRYLICIDCAPQSYLYSSFQYVLCYSFAQEFYRCCQDDPLALGHTCIARLGDVFGDYVEWWSFFGAGLIAFADDESPSGCYGVPRRAERVPSCETKPPWYSTAAVLLVSLVAPLSVVVLLLACTLLAMIYTNERRRAWKPLAPFWLQKLWPAPKTAHAATRPRGHSVSLDTSAFAPAPGMRLPAVLARGEDGTFLASVPLTEPPARRRKARRTLSLEDLTQLRGARSSAEREAALRRTKSHAALPKMRAPTDDRAPRRRDRPRRSSDPRSAAVPAAAAAAATAADTPAADDSHAHHWRRRRRKWDTMDAAEPAAALRTARQRALRRAKTQGALPRHQRRHGGDDEDVDEDAEGPLRRSRRRCSEEDARLRSAEARRERRLLRRRSEEDARPPGDGALLVPFGELFV